MDVIKLWAMLYYRCYLMNTIGVTLQTSEIAQNDTETYAYHPWQVVFRMNDMKSAGFQCEIWQIS